MKRFNALVLTFLIPLALGATSLIPSSLGGDSNLRIPITPRMPRTPLVSQVPVSNEEDGEGRVIRRVLRFGQSVAGLLEGGGFSPGEAAEAVVALGGIMDMRRVPAGREFLITQDEAGKPVMVHISVRYDSNAVLRLTQEGWQAEEENIDVYPVPIVVRAEVVSSLYQAAVDSGIPLSVMMQAIDLFSFEVDFQRDIQPGNRIVLLYERILDASGEFLAAGDLLYARLEVNQQRVEAWRHESLDGLVDYYEDSGDSVRKALLKTPVDGARISSGFGMRRHPILGYTALHRGIDFAVPTGTPVKAAGVGTVVQAGWHDQYGWRVKLRHANHYETLYAHFTRIAPGIRPGVPVTQGQIVGYVGSTGMSTGPHCHYEVRYYGRPVNPASLKFPPGHQLEGDDERLLTLEIQALKSEFDLD
ncbi:MAG: M23 family metallopeptidase [Spirochaetales bacterium]|nr:M23 family metallopeptidase [Spirochaetales bacterium]